jgi:hypothetical protein
MKHKIVKLWFTDLFQTPVSNVTPVIAKRYSSQNHIKVRKINYYHIQHRLKSHSEYLRITRSCSPSGFFPRHPKFCIHFSSPYACCMSCYFILLYLIILTKLRGNRDFAYAACMASRTVESWVRIPLEAWMSVYVYSMFVLFCLKVDALRRAEPLSKESYRLCIGLINCKSDQSRAIRIIITSMGKKYTRMLLLYRLKT